MHPRNFYRQKPPDFHSLALKYPAFREFCTVDLNGKAVFDFKSPEAIRILSMTLLKEDFDLDVDIPEGCLVPRLPVRLNYILWLEDLLLANNHYIKHTENCHVTGFDIGTGASCVYPLLAHKQCDWRFVATDKDQISAASATHNVEQNNLQDYITVLKVDGNVALLGAADQPQFQNLTFDFCMCNPPFYDCTERSDIEKRPDRPEPHSNTVARCNEIQAEGGELGFVTRIIEDSVQLKDKFRFFTSMVGKKSSLAPLKRKLLQVEVASLSTTNFQQGKTQRWAICWTFDPLINLKLEDLNPSQKDIHYVLSLNEIFGTVPTSLKTVEDAKHWINKELGQLEIEFKSSDASLLSCTAKWNTWSHQRKKKRKRNTAITVTGAKGDIDVEAPAAKRSRINGEGSLSQQLYHNDKTKLDKELNFSITVDSTCDDDADVKIDFGFVSGSSRDELHQIVQFFKNRLRQFTMSH